VSRITVADLENAARWLDECEDDAGLDIQSACRRVAAWLRREAQVREKGAAVRAVARERGISPAAVRLAVGLKTSR
jgi:hypothetical protein